MNIKQVGQLLRSQGVAESAIATFQQFNVSGKMLVDGLNDGELSDMGFKTPIQLRGIKTALQMLASEGWYVWVIMMNHRVLIFCRSIYLIAYDLIIMRIDIFEVVLYHYYSLLP